MDLLKAELKRKDGPSSGANGSAPPAKRYQRKGDLQAARLAEQKQEEERARQAKEAQLIEAGKKVARAEEAAGTSLSKGAFGGEDGVVASSSGEKAESSVPEAFNVSNEEAVRRLRSRGQPVRLFGESDKERRLRLRALQLIEERTEGGRNELMRVMEGLEGKMELEEVERRSKALVGAGAVKAVGSRGDTPDGGTPAVENPKPGEGEDVVVDVSLVKTNPRKVYPQIYYALKVRLDEVFVGRLR